ncbi:hypothetical protein GW17_00049833 [Ensete ventricosum]|nr:hypothetical protein GW17_00049833 [Ensete ventricosum]
MPNPDTLSSDSTDSLRAQLCLVNQRIDDVQKEVIRSKDDLRESSTDGSPFIPEIQDKPISEHFRHPLLEAYDGCSDSIEHVAAFRAQMAFHPNRYVRKPREPSLHLKCPMEKQINVIIEGSVAGGDSSLAQNAYARTEVQKRPRMWRDPKITFKSGDEKYPDHDDALVISAQIANARVKRIMIDPASLADILYFDVFQKLCMTNRDLASLTSTLV